MISTLSSTGVASDNAGHAAARSGSPAFLWSDIVQPFIATRVALLLIGCLATRFLLPSGQAPPRWLECFSRFDGLWYLSIARDGYFFDPARQSSIAFAPLLPILMRVIGCMFGSSDDAYIIAGIIISNLSLLVAIIFIRAMTVELFDERIARRAVWYVLICPGTLYLSAVYPMSLMLAIGSGAIYFARRERWEMASAIAMLAPLARPDGALLLFPLLIEAIRSKRIDRRLCWLLMIPAMSGIWLMAQWQAFGTPFAFIQAQRMWEPSPFITVYHSSRAGLILGMGAVFVLLTMVSWIRLPVSHALYASLYLSLILWSGRLWSLPRFVVILFPCFIALAWVSTRWRWLHVFYVVTATLIAVLFTIRFSLGLWVA